MQNQDDTHKVKKRLLKKLSTSKNSVKNENCKGADHAKKVWLASTFFAILAMTLFTRYGLLISSEQWVGIWEWIKKSNLNFYFSMLAVFAAVFLTIRFLLVDSSKKWFHIPDFNLPYAEYIGVTVISGSIGIGLIRWLMIDQENEFASRLSEFPIVTVPSGIILSLAAIAAIFLIREIRENKDISEYVLFGIYGICLMLTVSRLFFPNVFAADRHHGIAALETIYNVYKFTPFTYATTGIYGHYGLFFLIPMRLFGSDIVVVTALMALFGGISCVAVLYVIHKLLPKNWLRAMTACASVIHVVILRTTNYWQVQPIRVLFPTIFMAYGVFLCSKKLDLKRKCLIGWILGVLAVLWNTESGVFCLIAFVLYLLTEQWQKYQWYDRKMWQYYLYSVGFIVSGVVASVVILNVYNIIGGGPLIFDVFFFPLFDKEYTDGTLRYDMVWGNRIWLYVLILFLLELCWGIYHTRWFSDTKDNRWAQAPNAVLISVLGILSFSYYANRAAFYNLDICFPMIICAGAMLVGTLWNQVVKENSVVNLDLVLKKSSVLISITVLLGLSLHILYAPTKLKIVHERGYQSVLGVRQEAKELAAVVPENTYGIGGGTSIIYSLLGWDNYGTFRDSSDMYVGGRYAIDELLQSAWQKDSFVASNERASILQELLADSRYIQKASVSIAGLNYGYYVRRPEYVLGKEILVAGDFDTSDYFSSGLSNVETDFAWTDGKEMRMIFFFSKNIDRDLELRLGLNDVYHAPQQVVVEAAGKTLFEQQIEDAGSIIISVPKECVQEKSLELVFHLPNAVSPTELKEGEDGRVLALAISSFVMQEI